MRIAIPLENGRLASHFGHCAEFTLIDVVPDTKTIVCTENVLSPPHQPGLLPSWLKQHGATVIIAGGMGSRAQSLFNDNGIEVLIGAPSENPNVLAQAYLDGTLTTGANICDH
jgi:predicted Fe-Mo cluster-binding NifX family protein